MYLYGPVYPADKHLDDIASGLSLETAYRMVIVTASSGVNNSTLLQKLKTVVFVIADSR